MELRFLLAPERLVSQNGRCELECARMSLGDFDSSGRRRPEPVPDGRVLVEADTIIAAIGQRADVPGDADGHIDLSRRGTIGADRNSQVTKIEGVFAAGDAVSGPATVIEAIAQGERAAIAIDRHLRGESLAETILVGAAPPDERERAAEPDEDEGEGEERPRQCMPCLGASLRKTGFAEAELGFDRAGAIAEADRCLHCHRS